MTAPSFDPWAALKIIREGRPPPKPPNPPRVGAGRLGELGALGGQQGPARELSAPTAALRLGGLGSLGGGQGPQRDLRDRAAAPFSPDPWDAVRRLPSWSDPAVLPRPGDWRG